MNIPATLIIIYHQAIFQFLFFLKTFSLNNFLQRSIIHPQPVNLRFSLVLLLFISITLSSASSYQTYNSLIPLKIMDRSVADLIIFFSLILSIRILFMTLYDSKRSWRIGIDPHEKTELITDGIFRISRNPLMLCYFLTVLGYSLMVPNLAVIVSGITLLYFGNCAVLNEEEYLGTAHRQDYHKYLMEVDRYL